MDGQAGLDADTGYRSHREHLRREQPGPGAHDRQMTRRAGQVPAARWRFRASSPRQQSEDTCHRRRNTERNFRGSDQRSSARDAGWRAIERAPRKEQSRATENGSSSMTPRPPVRQGIHQRMRHHAPRPYQPERDKRFARMPAGDDSPPQLPQTGSEKTANGRSRGVRKDFHTGMPKVRMTMRSISGSAASRPAATGIRHPGRIAVNSGRLRAGSANAGTHDEMRMWLRTIP